MHNIKENQYFHLILESFMFEPKLTAFTNDIWPKFHTEANQREAKQVQNIVLLHNSVVYLHAAKSPRSFVPVDSILKQFC